MFIRRLFSTRTHSCGALNANHAGQQVTLAGWMLKPRKGKKHAFVPLRDSHGTTQLIVPNDMDMPTDLAAIPVESTVLVQGTVQLRPHTARRQNEPTGEIDVHVHNLTLLNPASNLPFIPSDQTVLPNDDLRARYRYLDLRRPTLSENIRKRSKVAQIIRTVLADQEFIEVETPLLFRSSPEGAREFLVPSRVQSGQFYALPQSPQQAKQLLICSGAVDRYYQIAKCFRDEDGRKDRQPEFTQVDLEMAFVSQTGPPNSDWRIGGSEVRNVMENLVCAIWGKMENTRLPESFPVMTYNHAMSRYGSDKPDTRFGLEIFDITHLLQQPERVSLEATNDIIECIIVKKDDIPFIQASSSTVDHTSVERIVIDKHNIWSWLPTSKTLPQDASHEEELYDCLHLNHDLGLMPGDHIWISRRPKTPTGGSTALGRLRSHLSEAAQKQGLVLPEEPHFLWVTEFPLFTRDDKDKEFLAHGRWSSTHHPFTAPMQEDIQALYEGRIESVRGQHYDLVLNGVEIGGGSVRVHDAGMQGYIFENVLKLDETEREPFQQLLDALRSGAPPHGGMALGFDRLMAILCKTQSIRDVIAFPKTSVGTDMLFKSPTKVADEILTQYGIKTL